LRGGGVGTGGEVKAAGVVGRPSTASKEALGLEGARGQIEPRRRGLGRLSCRTARNEGPRWRGLSRIQQRGTNERQAHGGGEQAGLPGGPAGLPQSRKMLLKPALPE